MNLLGRWEKAPWSSIRNTLDQGNNKSSPYGCGVEVDMFRFRRGSVC